MSKIELSAVMTSDEGAKNEFKITVTPIDGGINVKPEISVETSDDGNGFSLKFSLPATRFTSLKAFLDKLTPERAQTVIEKLQAFSTLFLK